VGPTVFTMLMESMTDIQQENFWARIVRHGSGYSDEAHCTGKP